MLQALSKTSWLYDSTLPEWWYPNSPTSPEADQLLLPYSMDSGIPQVWHRPGPALGCAQK